MTAHIFISNRFQDPQKDGMRHFFNEKLGDDYNTRPIFLNVECLLYLHESYRHNLEQIHANRNRFYEQLILLFTRENITKQEIDKIFKAVKSFYTLFGSLVAEQISSYYNPDFTIHFPPHSYSFAFLKNNIVICEIEENRILNIKSFNYTEFIPDSFLYALLSVEQLPSRVRRYRKIGLDRLRNEMVDELRLGAITAEDSTATWNDYQLKFCISPTLQMVRIKN